MQLFRGLLFALCVFSAGTLTLAADADDLSRSTQEALRQLGYPIVVDGVWGANSAAILNEFNFDFGNGLVGELSSQVTNDLHSASLLMDDYRDNQDISFPRYFFTDSLNPDVCDTFTSNFSNSRAYVRELLSQTDQQIEDSNSLTVEHDYLSLRWRELLELSYSAVATQNVLRATSLVALLVDLAEAETLLYSRTVAGAEGQVCWAGGDPDAPCVFHTPQHVAMTFVAQIISAIVLEDYIDASQREVLGNYYAKAFEQFIEPLGRRQAEHAGLYELGDFGIGVLAYARWIGDAALAEDEIERRARSFLTKIETSGYIDNNSYRGYRGYWYHTLGAESAFGYAILAREFGVDLFNDPRLKNRFQRLAERTAEGGSAYQTFLDLPRRGNNANAPQDAEMPHMHQMAINLPQVILNEFGISISTAPRYQQLIRHETVNRFVLYNSSCYYGSN